MAKLAKYGLLFRFFQRAVQLNSRCAYAYTLLGHEYVLTEELDKGLEAFRTAARIEPRHYNAWYGIGLIFFKQVSIVFYSDDRKYILRFFFVTPYKAFHM